MDRNHQDRQNCLANLVGAQVEEVAVRSREEGTDLAAAGTVGDFEKAEKQVVTHGTDKGTPLDCKDPRKALYPWSLDGGRTHCHHYNLELSSSSMKRL